MKHIITNTLIEEFVNVNVRVLSKNYDEVRPIFSNGTFFLFVTSLIISFTHFVRLQSELINL